MSSRSHILRLVARLKPGERISIDVRELNAAFRKYEHKGLTFTAADQVLENIVDSSDEYRYYKDELKRCITFERLRTGANGMEPDTYNPIGSYSLPSLEDLWKSIIYSNVPEKYRYLIDEPGGLTNGENNLATHYKPKTTNGYTQSLGY